MRVMQFNRADLTEIEVENDATLKKLLPRAREAAAAEGAGTHVLDAALWQVVVQTTDVTLWSRVLRTFGFHARGGREEDEETAVFPAVDEAATWLAPRALTMLAGRFGGAAPQEMGP